MADNEIVARRGRPAVISRETIIQAALDEGLAEFTMLPIAKRLGMTRGALWRYFNTREALSAAVVDSVIGNALWDYTPTQWRPLLSGFGEALWKLCEDTHGFAECLLLLPSNSAALDRVIDAHISAAHERGLSVEDARLAVDLICADVLRTSLASSRNRTPSSGPSSVPGASMPSESVNPSDWFHRRLELILDGLEHRLNQ